MRFARSKALVAILAVGMTPVAAHAQAAAKGAAKAAPSKAQIADAAGVLRVITSALQSDSVEQPVKNALFECMYANPVSKISEATDKVIAANPGKIDRKDASQMLVVIAGVCGFRPAAPTAPAPKK
ncbi:hypothetical protein [Sphingobium sp.]|uniref:hypothetical protein n=1 Tax=Sphingobium sp. TaxID=1912891 RepID=UPI003BB52D19